MCVDRPSDNQWWQAKLCSFLPHNILLQEIASIDQLCIDNNPNKILSSKAKGIDLSIAINVGNISRGYSYHPHDGGQYVKYLKSRPGFGKGKGRGSTLVHTHVHTHTCPHHREAVCLGELVAGHH